MKIWVTKYALTQGILAYSTGLDVVGHHMVRVRSKGGMDQYFHKGEWFESEEAAIVKAEQLRDSKIVSTRKKLAALEAMTSFKVSEVQ